MVINTSAIRRIMHAEDDEEILYVVYRHWLPIVLSGLSYLFVFSLFSFVVLFLDNLLSSSGQTFIPTTSEVSISVFCISFFGLVLWMRFFYLWSDTWLDVWIITNKRVVVIEQLGFFKREVANFPLDRIQDVTYIVRGVIATWFHYGDVRIQTASITEHLVMEQVPRPDLVKQWIVEASAQARATLLEEGGELIERI